MIILYRKRKCWRNGIFSIVMNLLNVVMRKTVGEILQFQKMVENLHYYDYYFYYDVHDWPLGLTSFNSNYNNVSMVNAAKSFKESLCRNSTEDGLNNYHKPSVEFIGPIFGMDRTGLIAIAPQNYWIELVRQVAVLGVKHWSLWR